ncbi:MAG: NTP transferase domain-containing protein, partial [Erysipelotrichaceae bacterium]
MNKTLKQKQEQKQTVQRAIIMAAGLSSRFAPLSYERPKGLLVVRGEVLIERQIRQLQAAGVTEIIVVTGYLGQQYAYLADVFGVRLVANPYYKTRNNHSSLWMVADKLEDAWICSSDNYFLENPFLETPVEATYALVEQTTPANEYFVSLDEAA